jgi:hypothetical protein
MHAAPKRYPDEQYRFFGKSDLLPGEDLLACVAQIMNMAFDDEKRPPPSLQDVRSRICNVSLIATEVVRFV